MADRRMFSKKITEADQFTELPPTSQALYFHLCMSADDDGFSNEIRKSMFNAHASTTDFNTLVNARFILPFESGVIVIKHWKLHNYIQNDRYHETQFLEEKAMLILKDNNVYTEKLPTASDTDTVCIQNGYGTDTEVSIGKYRVGKGRKWENNTSSEIDQLFEEFWEAYPKKKAKQDAYKVFHSLKPTRELLDEMLCAISAQKASDQWQNTKYIPEPPKWLRGRRWEDDADEPQASDGFDNLRNLYNQFKQEEEAHEQE